MPKSLGVISITPWGARETCEEPGMAAHACGHSTWEIEAGESGVQGWLGYIVSLSLGFMRLSLKTSKPPAKQGQALATLGEFSSPVSRAAIHPSLSSGGLLLRCVFTSHTFLQRTPKEDHYVLVFSDAGSQLHPFLAGPLDSLW